MPLFYLKISFEEFCLFKLDTFSVAFRKIAKSHYELRHVCLSVYPSVRMELGSHWTDFMQFYIWVFFENLL